MSQFTAGGYNWYPQGTTVNPNLPIIKPAHYTGLLGKQKTADALKDFAGGLLSQGYQYDPSGNAPHMFQGGGGLLSAGAQARQAPAGGNYFAPMAQQAPQPMDNQYVSAVEPSGIYNSGEVGGDGVDEGNGLAGDYTFREMLTRQMSAATPWRYKQMYGQDYHHGGDWAALAFADPAMLKDDKARENYDAHWANVLGADPAIMDEVYDPTNAAQGELMDRLMQDQARKIANDKMDSGIWGHGGGDGGNDGGQGGGQGGDD